jgi:hypothetical protein
MRPFPKYLYPHHHGGIVTFRGDIVQKSEVKAYEEPLEKFL